jgi:phosphoribosylformylglycinamidine synthase I
MGKPPIIVLRATGINCEHETAYAWEQAGGAPQIVHVSALITQPGLLDEFAILTIPGGFSYGDDISAGRILARRLLQRLADPLHRFVERGGLILGICNGFQVLVEAGLLTAGCDEPCALAFNTSGHYVCRWVTVESTNSPCVMLPAGSRLFLSMAHAEGRIALRAGTMVAPERAAVRYVPGVPRVGPVNPNGSCDDIAGLTDATGRILGLMPHPERYVRRTQHPFWTAGDVAEEGDGMVIFRSAIGQVV